MARKTPKASRASASRSAGKTKPKNVTVTADEIVDASLALAAEQPWDKVRLGDIADRAGVSLADLRASFDSKTDILANFSKRIDKAVLNSLDADLDAEPVRDRLFDVLMGRFDALSAHKAAVRSIVRSYDRRPGDLLQWNPVAVRSMAWMLEAAGIDTTGRLGAVGAQGLAIVFGRTLRVWLDDDDPGMARTMVALDRRLTEGGRWMSRFESLLGIADAVSRIRKGRRGRYGRKAPPDEEEIAGAGI